MRDVKLFRIKGAILKPNYKTSFTRDIRGLNSHDVIEKIYAELGSHHHVKRVHISIHTIEEIDQQNE